MAALQFFTFQLTCSIYIKGLKRLWKMTEIMEMTDIQTHDYKLLWLVCPSYPDHVGHDMKNRLQQTQPCWRANFIGHAKCDRYLVLRCANPLKTKHEAKCVYCLLWTLRSVLTWVFLWGVCLLSMCLCTLSLGDCGFPLWSKTSYCSLDSCRTWSDTRRRESFICVVVWATATLPV